MVSYCRRGKIQIQIYRNLNLVIFVGSKENLAYLVLHLGLPLGLHPKLGACIPGSAVAVIPGIQGISVGIHDHHIFRCLVADGYRYRLCNPCRCIRRDLLLHL